MMFYVNNELVFISGGLMLFPWFYHAQDEIVVYDSWKFLSGILVEEETCVESRFLDFNLGCCTER